MNDIANIQIIIPLLSKAKTSPKTFGFSFHKSSASALAFFTHFSQCVCVLQLQILLSLLFSTSPLAGEINKECDLLLCLHEREETKANTFLSIFQEPSSNLSAYKKSGDKKARPQRPRLKKGHFSKPSRTFTTNCFWRFFGAEFCVPFMSTYGYDPLSLGTFYYEWSHTFYHHDHEWPEQTSVFFLSF